MNGDEKIVLDVFSTTSSKEEYEIKKKYDLFEKKEITRSRVFEIVELLRGEGCMVKLFPPIFVGNNKWTIVFDVLQEFRGRLLE